MAAVESAESRFASVSEDEITALLLDKDSVNKTSNKGISWSFAVVFARKRQVNGLCVPSSSLSKRAAKKFYVEARRKDKQPYTKLSLTAIRFGLCRHIKNSRPDVDIINGSEFEDENRVFKAKTVELKRQGKAKVEHKPPIAPEDLKKLYRSQAFDMATPTGLQNKVWFEVMLFSVDVDRKTFVSSKEILLDLEWMPQAGDMLFRIETSSQRTEGKIAKLKKVDLCMRDRTIQCVLYVPFIYISKLNPECDAFFQQPKKQTTEGSLAWYDKQVVSINTLGSKTKPSQNMLSYQGNTQITRSEPLLSLFLTIVDLKHVISCVLVNVSLPCPVV